MSEPWFVGKDVAIILGYKDSVNALKSHIDNEDKLMWQITTSGQKRKVTIINESGFYSLVFGSELPTAKKIKHWVTSEVLPSIRKKHLIESEDYFVRKTDEAENEYGIIAPNGLTLLTESGYLLLAKYE